MAPLETSAKKWLQPGLDSWPLLSFLESSRGSFQLCSVALHLLNGLRQVCGLDTQPPLGVAALVRGLGGSRILAGWVLTPGVGLRSGCCMQPECLVKEPPDPAQDALVSGSLMPEQTTLVVDAK